MMSVADEGSVPRSANAPESGVSSCLFYRVRGGSGWDGEFRECLLWILSISMRAMEDWWCKIILVVYCGLHSMSRV